jgi:hypothetical protein
MQCLSEPSANGARFSGAIHLEGVPVSGPGKLQKEVPGLPQEKVAWLVVLRRLRTWPEEAGEIVRPWTILCISRSARTITGRQILLSPPASQEALKMLFEAMLELLPSSTRFQCRPAKIAFEDKGFGRDLQVSLNSNLYAHHLGSQVGVRATGDFVPAR